MSYNMKGIERELYMANDLMVQSVSYHITQIVEEKVPLSGGAGAPYYWIMVGTLIVLMSILLVIGYIAWCMQYRRRVIELQGGSREHIGWNYRKLRMRINELEIQRAEEMMQKTGCFRK